MKNSLYLFLDERVSANLNNPERAAPGRSFKFRNVTVRMDAGCRIYHEVEDDRVSKEDLVPQPLVGLVELFSWRVWLTKSCPTKTPGRYVHQNAKATVKPADNGSLTATITGPSLNEVYHLRYLLRLGTARLVESWDYNPKESAPPVQSRRAVDREAVSPKVVYTLSSNSEIDCPKCRARYSVDSDEIRDGVVTTFCCKKCRHTIAFIKQDESDQDGPTEHKNDALN